ncbi:hypothetical protein E2C01_069587 [Portunus trituberculatus]|uniref:Uncharacterized protein n=1 Tax=Portunus trituberculatus TaxID=210409 RepID=A0A5B7HYY5_PORTR|nr:hypothetical protein [Portunus trituberculatus]
MNTDECMGTFLGTSYLKVHPLGNRYPKQGSPTYTRTVGRIRTRVLGDPSDPKARVVNPFSTATYFYLECYV